MLVWGRRKRSSEGWRSWGNTLDLFQMRGAASRREWEQEREKRTTPLRDHLSITRSHFPPDVPQHAGPLSPTQILYHFLLCWCLLAEPPLSPQCLGALKRLLYKVLKPKNVHLGIWDVYIRSSVAQLTTLINYSRHAYSLYEVMTFTKVSFLCVWTLLKPQFLCAFKN